MASFTERNHNSLGLFVIGPGNAHLAGRDSRLIKIPVTLGNPSGDTVGAFT
jgi:hypothetical protein